MPKFPLTLLATVCMSLLSWPAFADESVTFCLTDQYDDSAEQLPSLFLSDDEDFDRHASFQEQPVRVAPRATVAGTELPMLALQLEADLFNPQTSLSRSLLAPDRRVMPVSVGTSNVWQPEATVRNAADAGDMLRRSPAVVGVGNQRRNPIVNDPRIRGSRIGSLGASGSYWIPARMDLDTAMSKIDSRILSDVLVVKGPYAARYGPGFSFIDFSLLPSPRYEDGFETHGTTGADFQSNGQQWSGRQRLRGGAADWGFGVSYGHRTGNDYVSGNGSDTAASYNSRDLDVAVGGDLTSQRHVEFNYLRQDQTNVELPGQAFDIDMLYVDGYEVSYISEDESYVDSLALDVWYNRTRFDGSAQRSSKRDQFPYYDIVGFTGHTDVDSLSTGYRLAGTWGDEACEYLTVGADLRYIKQQLNEITSVRYGPSTWDDANSPIPRSYSADPGLFLECGAQLTEQWSAAAGARFDVVHTDVVEDPQELASIGTESISLADILGSSDFSQTSPLWSLYLTGEYQMNECWTAEVAAGYAQRPPTLTELYAAQTFMFVLQNGLNTVTGDPLLKPEQLLQADVGLKFEGERLRAAASGFYGWAWNYITFENMYKINGPPLGEVVQEQLKFVNTDLATFVGGELYGEWDAASWLTPFATLSYVAGTDRTRNGHYATKQASSVAPSTRVSGRPRGWFSGIASEEGEPLPSIVPLESRLGVRWHEAGPTPRWSVELAARVVDAQDRIAVSLMERPSSGFTVWDVRGYWRVTPHLLTIAGIENFTDKNYREHLNFTSQDGTIQVYQPGINFYVASELSY